MSMKLHPFKLYRTACLADVYPRKTYTAVETQRISITPKASLLPSAACGPPPLPQATTDLLHVGGSGSRCGLSGGFTLRTFYGPLSSPASLACPPPPGHPGALYMLCPLPGCSSSRWPPPPCPQGCVRMSQHQGGLPDAERSLAPCMPSPPGLAVFPGFTCSLALSVNSRRAGPLSAGFLLSELPASITPLGWE